MIFGIQNNREWTTFCMRVLNRPALADDPRFQGNRRRVQHRAALDAEESRRCSATSGRRVMTRLEAAQIANARTQHG